MSNIEEPVLYQHLIRLRLDILARSPEMPAQEDRFSLADNRANIYKVLILTFPSVIE